jgi:hypothetical protein
VPYAHRRSRAIAREVIDANAKALLVPSGCPSGPLGD